ncbi:MAG TPA: hypothetical protein VKF38_01800 [Anaerolineaceae bacterium]|nr:hypothetical protein [Anaerolineaceae bacterium]
MRMFVYSEYHGNGAGRALAESVIREVRSIVYKSIRSPSPLPASLD